MTIHGNKAYGVNSFVLPIHLVGIRPSPIERYPTLNELEVRHGVDFGQAYTTKDSAKVFSHYTKLRDNVESFSNYSFLMDGSADIRNTEDELIIILSYTKDTAAEEVDRFSLCKSPKELMLMD